MLFMAIYHSQRLIGVFRKNKAPKTRNLGNLVVEYLAHRLLVLIGVPIHSRPPFDMERSEHLKTTKNTKKGKNVQRLKLKAFKVDEPHERESKNTEYVISFLQMGF